MKRCHAVPPFSSFVQNRYSTCVTYMGPKVFITVFINRDGSSHSWNVTFFALFMQCGYSEYIYTMGKKHAHFTYVYPAVVLILESS